MTSFKLSFYSAMLCICGTQKGNFVISKIKGTSLWNFVLKSGLRKFRHGISIVERVINLARERWTLRA